MARMNMVGTLLFIATWVWLEPRFTMSSVAIMA